jgi:hypothetical protein
VSLRNVWLSTWADGLIRADQVVGIHTHRTPTLGGKPSHWLLDVVLDSPTGAGSPEQWAVSPLHRTLAQTSRRPAEASAHLARLLAQLDATNAAGVITTVPTTAQEPTDTGAGPARETGESGDVMVVRFRFTPFQATEPGHRYDPDYL